MSTRSAKLRPCKVEGLTTSLVGLCCIALGVLGASPSQRQLYLLASTPTPNVPQSFPARLYKLGPDRNLQLVREIVAGGDGVFSVNDGGSALSVLYPFVIPRSVGVIHKSDPTRVDNIPVNPDGLPVYGFAASLASRNEELLQLVPLIVSTGPVWPKKLQLVGAVLEPATAPVRVAATAMDDYARIVDFGQPGTPDFGFALTGKASSSLSIDIGGTLVQIASGPKGLWASQEPVQVRLIACGPRFLVVAASHNPTQLNSLPNKMTNYVEDRTRNTWKTVEVPGNVSRERLLGVWLATIEQAWSPNNETNPGRDLERGSRRAGPTRLPDVQNMYAAFRGRNQAIPGFLILSNLDDGRQITIETHMEDSEVLDVNNERVLYRVNDTIYQAEIDGSKLGPPTIIAKDEDVPEIHWVFWSR